MKKHAILDIAMGAYRAHQLNDKERDLMNKAYDLDPSIDLRLRNAARGAVGGAAGLLAGALPVTALASSGHPFLSTALSLAAPLGGAYLMTDKYSKEGLEEARRILEQRRKRAAKRG